MDDRAREEFEARLNEYGDTARDLLQHARDASAHFRRGEIQSAWSVISLSTYLLERAVGERQELMRLFHDNGIERGSHH